jgi:GNAT superfamily N-acetyltransferase
VDARLERVEAEAFASLAESAGLPLLRIAGAVCTAAPIAPSNPLLNRVAGIGDADDDELDAIDAFFVENAIPRYVVAPAEPVLAERLAARGFDLRPGWMKFCRDATAAAPASATPLRIGEATRKDVEAIVASVYGEPPEAVELFAAVVGVEGWHWFAAYDGDELAACAALFAHDGAGWLGAAGTFPDHRGRGAQSALLAARIARARELGLDVLTAETGARRDDGANTSYDNILRAGFVEAYERANLVSPES